MQIMSFEKCSDIVVITYVQHNSRLKKRRIIIHYCNNTYITIDNKIIGTRNDSLCRQCNFLPSQPLLDDLEEMTSILSYKGQGYIV